MHRSIGQRLTLPTTSNPSKSLVDFKRAKFVVWARRERLKVRSAITGNAFEGTNPYSDTAANVAQEEEV
jgi:hypothetical protein